MNWIKSILKKIKRVSSSPKKQMQFGFLIITVLIVLLISSIYKKGILFNATQLIIICTFLAISILILTYRKGLFSMLFLWLLFGELLGKFTNYVILGFIYYLVFSPFALILNISNKKNRYKAAWLNRKKPIDYESLS